MRAEPSAQLITIKVNGDSYQVAPGTSVAAALMNSGRSQFRRSVDGETRGPVCGMGICYECRVSIDGVSQIRSCTVRCVEGMEVLTDV